MLFRFQVFGGIFQISCSIPLRSENILGVTEIFHVHYDLFYGPGHVLASYLFCVCLRRMYTLPSLGEFSEVNQLRSADSVVKS